MINPGRGLAAACLLCASAFFTACGGGNPKVETEEEGARLASVLPMNDARATQQILTGVFNLEANSWRWTTGKFSFGLRPPEGAATKGATLHLKLVLLDAVLKPLKSVTLSSKVGDAPLAPETYTTTGSFVYTRDVPASAFRGSVARVDFQLDKVLPKSVDPRELGLIVTEVDLAAK